MPFLAFVEKIRIFFYRSNNKVNYTILSLWNIQREFKTQVILHLFFFNLFIFWRLITLQYCTGFTIHWHESATGVHMYTSYLKMFPSHLQQLEFLLGLLHSPQLGTASPSQSLLAPSLYTYSALPQTFLLHFCPSHSYTSDLDVTSDPISSQRIFPDSPIQYFPLDSIYHFTHYDSLLDTP